MVSPKTRILVLAKDKPGLAGAIEYLRARAPLTELLTGQVGDAFPASALKWRGDILVSYLSPWIIPPQSLQSAAAGAVNFHPGPPEYPGIGCTNFALYERAREFGVTAHHMNPKVDTGAVIAVRRFPILDEDSVHSLTMRCYEHIEALFRAVFEAFFKTGAWPVSTESWTRPPFRRKQLDELCRITPDMSPEEIARRARATTYPGMPGPFVEIAGRRFELK